MRTRITRFIHLHRIVQHFIVTTLSGPFAAYDDLSIRFLLGGIFVTSGYLKATNWPVALELARSEYPVSWLAPTAAAYLGVSIELVGGLLLGLGLLTRVAAIALLGLTLVIQFAYVAVDTQLYWIAVLGWFVISGAGPISVDYVMGRVLAGTVGPTFRAAARGAKWLRGTAASPYLAILRIWLGFALIVAPFAATRGWNLWLPVEGMRLPVRSLAVVCGCFFVLGLGTRYIALLLCIALSFSAMMISQMTHQVSAVALLTLFIVDGGGELSLDAWVDKLLLRRIPGLRTAA